MNRYTSIKRLLIHKILKYHDNIIIDYYSLYKVLSHISHKKIRTKNFSINDEYKSYITNPYASEQSLYCMLNFINTFQKTKDFSKMTLTEGTSGVGGDSINFCKTFKHVNLFEYNDVAFDMLTNNINKFCTNNNIIMYNQSYTQKWKELKQDVIIIDPPWGGPSYKFIDHVQLKYGEYDFFDFINLLAKKKASDYIFSKIPLNTDFKKFKYSSRSKMYVIYNEVERPSFFLLCISNIPNVTNIKRRKRSNKKSKRKSRH